MSTPCKFASAAEAKKGNWFSRRHQTSAEHHEASKAREARIDAQLYATQERIEKQEAFRARMDAQAAERKAAS